MKIHPVFHVSLLEPASTDPLPGQVNSNPPRIEVEDEILWQVEEVLDSRRRRKKLEYLIKWIGDHHPTWEPVSNLSQMPDMLANFHEVYPRRPR